MFINLRTALFQEGISIKQYAKFLAIDEGSAESKMAGSTDFTFLEFKRTCSLLLPEYSADYLFTECQSKNCLASCINLFTFLGNNV